MARSIPFAAIVRAAMKQHLPAYKYAKTEGGSGPVVFFRSPAKDRRIEQSVFLQKGLNSQWIRANIGTSFVDKRGRVHEVVQTSLPDYRYADADALTAHLATLLPRVHKACIKEAAKVSKLAPQLGATLDDPQKLVRAWMKVEGSTLPPEDFDPASFAFEAFECLKRWLRTKKLFVPAGETGLWHWWTDHHPKVRGPIKYAKPTKVTLRHPKTGARIVVAVNKDEVDYTMYRRGESDAGGQGSVSYHPSAKSAIAAGEEAVRYAKQQGYVDAPIAKR